MCVATERRHPETTVCAPIVEIAASPVEISRHHNRKREAAESSGRKVAKKMETTPEELRWISDGLATART